MHPLRLRAVRCWQYSSYVIHPGTQLQIVNASFPVCELHFAMLTKHTMIKLEYTMLRKTSGHEWQEIQDDIGFPANTVGKAVADGVESLRDNSPD